MSSLFNKGDTVTLIEKYHPGYIEKDYPYGLLTDSLKLWGGKQGKIVRVARAAPHTFTRLSIENWVYIVDFGDTCNPSTSYHFPALAFQECSCITPNRSFWDILWTRRYPDIIFDRIRKNLTVDIDKTSGLVGGFVFSNTPEGHKFWDTINSADMKQLIECIAWLINEFPQEFYLINPTISTNNLTINQDEDQLQRTKINLGRDENQRRIICVYPENRPRVTISSLGYTAIGYRSGIEISRCKN